MWFFHSPLSDTLRSDTKFSKLFILWTEPLSVTIHWKAVEQSFSVVLFVVQFYPVCNFGKLMKFGLRTIRSERGFVSASFQLLVVF